VHVAIGVLVAVIALVFAGCGGDDDDGTTEATAPPTTTTEAPVPPKTSLPPKPSPEQVQALRRDANTWASLFAVKACNRYMGQPLCEQLACQSGAVVIENCTPVSAAFQKSFADATVEDIEYKGSLHLAAVTYSNGVVVVFSGGRPGPEPPEGSCAGSGGSCAWNIAEPGKNRRFVEAATG
jgi:hypothetical protein